jgi:hypothetical protein
VARAEGGEVTRIGGCRLPDELLDAAGGRDREAAGLGVFGIEERVGEMGRDEHERAGVQLGLGLADGEDDGPVQDEEGLDGLAVQVERRPGVPGRQDGLEHGEVAVAVSGAGLDEDGRLVPDLLSRPGAAHGRVGERAPASGRRVELVEALDVLLAAVSPRPEHVAEAHARRVDVQEERGRVARVSERVHDVRGRGGERPGTAAHRPHVWTEPELELSLEDVEGIRVPPVDVRIRPLLARHVAEPGQRQLVAVGEYPQRPLGAIRDGLAFAGG